MELLKQRIIEEGQILPGNIVKVDGFLNQRVDIDLMIQMAQEIGQYFDMNKIDMILTVEASGIALATICAQQFKKSMVFAKKGRSKNMDADLYQTDIFSYTYRKLVTLSVAKRLISTKDRVLIVDDFIANGEVVNGLMEIIKAAGATLVGVTCAIEKGFQQGGKRLREKGINLKSLAIIDHIDVNTLVFKD